MLDSETLKLHKDEIARLTSQLEQMFAEVERRDAFIKATGLWEKFYSERKH